MATFGKSKDLQELGSRAALDTLGIVKMPKPPSAPKPKARPEHEYTTSGAYENPKVAVAKFDAPNYRERDYKKNSCLTCRNFKKTDAMLGVCSKYNFHARHDYVCDSWKS